MVGFDLPVGRSVSRDDPRARAVSLSTHLICWACVVEHGPPKRRELVLPPSLQFGFLMMLGLRQAGSTSHARLHWFRMTPASDM